MLYRKVEDQQNRSNAFKMSNDMITFASELASTEANIVRQLQAVWKLTYQLCPLHFVDFSSILRCLLGAPRRLACAEDA